MDVLDGDHQGRKVTELQFVHHASPVVGSRCNEGEARDGFAFFASCSQLFAWRASDGYDSFLDFLTGVQRSVQDSADNAGIADYVQEKNEWK